MTDTDTRTHNAKDILQESLDTIRATFWMQHQEAKFAHTDQWAETDKAVIASLDDDAGWSNMAYFQNSEQDDKVKVIGVCSIGALALANVTLYDEPLTSYDRIVNRDIETWKAAQALYQAIVDNDPGYLDDTAGSGIANWNDYHGRTREEVIDAFERALDSPLLAGTEFYQLVGESPRWGTQNVCLFFPSEAKAQEFIDTPSEVRDRVLAIVDVDDADPQLSFKKFTHDSMVGSNA